MYMSDGDIVLEYRQAKDPHMQIRILADENLTTPLKIREVLARNGVFRKLSQEERGEGKTRMDLYREGLTDKEIAERTNYTQQGICKWRISRGLPVNKKRRKDDSERTGRPD